MISEGPIYNQIRNKSVNNIKQIAVLIDPDKSNDNHIERVAKLVEDTPIDYVFVGGSIIFSDINKCVDKIKTYTNKPVILFPGHSSHICENADAILLLSMISGRNADYLIGNHVISAPKLFNSNIEIISTSYILIDGGNNTSVQYISNTQAIPSDKPDITLATAMAGEMIGHKLIYLEAGSGALNPVSDEMIRLVKQNLSVPVIVGGGLKCVQSIEAKLTVGADIIVIGTAIENDKDFIKNLYQL